MPEQKGAVRALLENLGVMVEEGKVILTYAEWQQIDAAAGELEAKVNALMTGDAGEFDNTVLLNELAALRTDLTTAGTQILMQEKALEISRAEIVALKANTSKSVLRRIAAQLRRKT